MAATAWDARYGAPGYLFGTEPAAFLRRHGGRLAPGARVLSVADGEGRNAVWLARQGHAVTAFDASSVALDKARLLAAEAGVTVAFHHAGVEDWDWRPAAFDAVVAVFVQFAPPPLRARMFEGMARTLRPGGLLLLHGYAPRQIGYGTGGPGAVENLYTLPMLCDAFAGWQVPHAADHDADLAEGTGHAGRSALVDFVALKPV
ncbi:class I SAM-dependent methyltransferase [Rhodobaculum claviforme]|uniref:SAM-dependent methyltransferase n=1 Tax=Rhodobaculum claviforme TaxID=1549854 RepID=A0A934TIB0_9RHOB|nr:class I SAM-dependent methyltransferase [Rhodobaculum claviforme]MBK5926199.1 SAM-dependent methyltransferase [Rhodobaculum claviforme]